MGMFDYVDVVLPCLSCGRMMDGFQTKDGICNMDRIGTEKINRFYTDCVNCGTWNEWSRKIMSRSDLLNFEPDSEAINRVPLVRDRKTFKVSNEPLA